MSEVLKRLSRALQVMADTLPETQPTDAGECDWLADAIDNAIKELNEARALVVVDRIRFAKKEAAEDAAWDRMIAERNRQNCAPVSAAEIFGVKP